MCECGLLVSTAVHLVFIYWLTMLTMRRGYRPASLPAEVAWELGAAASNMRSDVEDAHRYDSMGCAGI